MRKLSVSLLVSLMLIIGTVTQSNADVSVFTEHTVVHMVQHGVNSNVDVPFPTGKLPYIGKVGLKYNHGAVTYAAGYIHRSNADLTNQNEYNYDGVFASVELSKCIFWCSSPK